jgi:hypothetical protein
LALALAAMAFALLFVTEVASAQSWWPFGGGGDDRDQERDRDAPPVPQEPVYRQPPAAPMPQQGGPPSAYPSEPPAQPQAGAPPGPQSAPPQQSSASTYRNPICLQLEQRLVQENQKNGNSQSDLPRIENDIRQLERTVDQNQQRLDHGCYEYFLFTKSLKDNPQCRDLARQVDASKRQLSDLDAQRQDILGSAGRSYQDDIVRELARNNCGANYSAMARRAGGDSGGMWEDEESSGGNTWNPRAANGAQTYRTLCVRLCDGFYFPVSFSTLPSHFEQDADMCSAHCAAPSELYYYANPGGTVEQAVSIKDQVPYTKLKFAFRYRKEYVNGCSCRTADYVPPPGEVDKRAQALPPGGDAQRHADAAQPPAAGAPAVQSETLPDAQPATKAPSVGTDGWQTQSQPQPQ